MEKGKQEQSEKHNLTIDLEADKIIHMVASLIKNVEKYGSVGSFFCLIDF